MQSAKMSDSMRALIDGEAELNEEEDDESFDEEAGVSRGRDHNDMLDDSSEEDEDEEDEEEARRVCHYPTLATPVLLWDSSDRPSTADSRRFHCG